MKVKISQVISILFPLLFALGRGSSWSICTTKYRIYVFVLAFLSVSYFLYRNKWRIPLYLFRKNSIPWLFLLTLVPSMLFVEPSVNLGSNLLFVMGFISVYLYSLLYSKKELIESYLRLVSFLAVISLLFYFAINIYGIPSNWMINLVKIGDSYEQFRSIILYSIRLIDSKRNSGLFWEPSIFASYLVFALQLELFFTERINKKRTLVFIITIMSTLSTGGLIVLIITVFMWLWRNKKTNYIAFFFSLFLVFVTWLGIDYLEKWLLSVNYSLFIKIFDFSKNKSSMSRIYSIITNVEIWKRSPLLGVGQVGVDELYREVSLGVVPLSLELHPSQSATPAIFLAAFGIMGLFYSAAWVIGIVNSKNLSSIQRVLFAICIFIILTEVPNNNFLLSHFILFMLLKKR